MSGSRTRRPAGSRRARRPGAPGSSDGQPLVVCIDGASRGNPGPAAIGVRVLRGGRVVREIAERIGTTTNNVAEYRAILRGLREARDLGARTVRVQSDSELLVRQLTGVYRVRHEALVPLHRDALAWMREFEHVDVAHVPRAENAAADALANRALDEGPGGDETHARS